MELRLPHIIHLYNVFLENDGAENCAQLIEEEFNKMFGIKSLNDEHDCNVVSMNSMNIQNTNDDCTSLLTPVFDTKTSHGRSSRQNGLRGGSTAYHSGSTARAVLP